MLRASGGLGLLDAVASEEVGRAGAGPGAGEGAKAEAEKVTA